MAGRPSRSGRTPANTGRAHISLGAFFGGGDGGGVEAMDPSEVDPYDASFDARSQTRFQPKNSFTNFLSGGKATATADRLNATSVFQDQQNQNQLRDAIARLNAENNINQANKLKTAGDLGRNLRLYSKESGAGYPDIFNTVGNDTGLGEYYGATYGRETPFIRGFNEEGQLKNQNIVNETARPYLQGLTKATKGVELNKANAELGATADSRYPTAYKNDFFAKLDEALAKSLNETGRATQESDVRNLTNDQTIDNAIQDARNKGMELKAHEEDFPTIREANLSTARATPYFNIERYLAGLEGPKFGEGTVLQYDPNTWRPNLIHVPSAKGNQSSELLTNASLTPTVTLLDNTVNGQKMTDPATGRVIAIPKVDRNISTILGKGGNNPPPTSAARPSPLSPQTNNLQQKPSSVVPSPTEQSQPSAKLTPGKFIKPSSDVRGMMMQDPAYKYSNNIVEPDELTSLIKKILDLQSRNTLYQY